MSTKGGKKGIYTSLQTTLLSITETRSFLNGYKKLHFAFEVYTIRNVFATPLKVKKNTTVHLTKKILILKALTHFLQTSLRYKWFVTKPQFLPITATNTGYKTQKLMIC